MTLKSLRNDMREAAGMIRREVGVTLVGGMTWRKDVAEESGDESVRGTMGREDEEG